MYPLLSSFLQLPETEILSHEIRGNKIYVDVQSTKDEVHCRNCGKICQSKGHAQMREIRHLPMGNMECYLRIRAKRGICEHCDDNPTTNQRLEWYDYKSRYTKAYIQDVMLSLVNATVEEVAKKRSMSAGAVHRIISTQIESKVNWNDIKQLGIIGIDEIALKKGHDGYLTVITSRYNDRIKIGSFPIIVKKRFL